MRTKSKCPKCGKFAVEFVQECETGQMVCGGPVVYFCSSDMIYEYMLGGLEESDAKERLTQDYGCGHIVSQGTDFSPSFVTGGRFGGELHPTE